jgi:fructose-bisphosphate aldolase class 1
MRAGMIPIVTPEAGIDPAERCGRVMEDISIEGIKKLVQQLGEANQKEIIEKSLQTYKESAIYSQGKFFADARTFTY